MKGKLLTLVIGLVIGSLLLGVIYAQTGTVTLVPGDSVVVACATCEPCLDTPVPPTETSTPEPTSTPIPPTETPTLTLTATSTPEPTDTPVPPTDTPEPTTTPSPPSAILYGMIWPVGARQFPQLREWGINLVWVGVGDNQREWRAVYDAAIANDIKVNAILWREPDTVWTQNFNAGRPFLEWLRDNPQYLEATWAVYGTNEPWFSGTSPSKLASVYQRIKAIVDVPVYCAGCPDHPSYRGGGMYDYTHAGGFPFGRNRQDFDGSMEELDFVYSLVESNYNGMGDVGLVFKAQTCRGVDPWDRFPTIDELRHLSWLVLSPESPHSGQIVAYVWYPWERGPYFESLVDHPEIYNVLMREVYEEYFR